MCTLRSRARDAEGSSNRLLKKRCQTKEGKAAKGLLNKKMGIGNIPDRGGQRVDAYRQEGG